MVHPFSYENRIFGMRRMIIAYISSLVAMLALDSVWLSVTASRLYHAELGPLLLPSFNIIPAAAFYLIYVAGIIVLVVRPALVERRLGAAPLRGALLGLVAYSTYDLTNQATMRGWSSTVTVADLCWGALLTALVATAGYCVTALIAPRRG